MGRSWTGDKHTEIFGQLTALANHWSPRYIICDNTGIGAGLTSFLTKVLREARVIPFTFTQSSKSKLAWDFICVIETGRFQDHVPPTGFAPTDKYFTNQDLFWQQVNACQSEIVPGPNRIIRWSVPDGTRDTTTTGEIIHDDLLISAAMCSILDEYPWGIGQSTVIPGFEPLSSSEF